MRRRTIEFLVLAVMSISVAIGAGPIGAAMWNWSTTAGSNATADPSINWSEGMAPSAVNDSARAMMAALAGWRNDISAANTSAGTSTAYTLVTSEGVNTTPVNGQMIAFIAHATNGASPTLTVDGGNTYPIWLNGAVVGAGTLVAGTPYRVAFKASNSAWLLEAGYGSPYSISLGGLLPSTLGTPPNSNFILPAGQCISTTTYAAYWVALGSPASGACPGGQFAVIDMRGRAPFALDNLNGTPANRMTSAATGCGVSFTVMGTACGNQSHNILQTEIPSYALSFTQPAFSTDAPHITATTAITYGGPSGPVNVPTATNTASVFITTSVAANSGGSGVAMPIVPPAVGVFYFLRVL